MLYTVLDESKDYRAHHDLLGQPYHVFVSKECLDEDMSRYGSHEQTLCASCANRGLPGSS